MLAAQALGDVRQQRRATAPTWTSALESDLELAQRVGVGIDEAALRQILTGPVAPSTAAANDHPTDQLQYWVRSLSRWVVRTKMAESATQPAPHLLATAIEEGRDLSSMSGILADSSYRLLPA
jgi:hypothetical protein